MWLLKMAKFFRRDTFWAPSTSPRPRPTSVSSSTFWRHTFAVYTLDSWHFDTLGIWTKEVKGQADNTDARFGIFYRNVLSSVCLSLPHYYGRGFRVYGTMGDKPHHKAGCQ